MHEPAALPASLPVFCSRVTHHKDTPLTPPRTLLTLCHVALAHAGFVKTCPGRSQHQLSDGTETSTLPPACFGGTPMVPPPGPLPTLAYPGPRRRGCSPARCRSGWHCPRSPRTRSARRTPSPTGGTTSRRIGCRRCRGPCPGCTVRERPQPSGPYRGRWVLWASQWGPQGSWEGKSEQTPPQYVLGDGGPPLWEEEVQPTPPSPPTRITGHQGMHKQRMVPVPLTHCTGVPGGGLPVLVPAGGISWGHPGVLGCWLLSAAEQKR